jgi:hypothetical protein
VEVLSLAEVGVPRHGAYRWRRVEVELVPDGGDELGGFGAVVVRSLRIGCPSATPDPAFDAEDTSHVGEAGGVVGQVGQDEVGRDGVEGTAGKRQARRHRGDDRKTCSRFDLVEHPD